jgi:hypothetical protein
MSGIEDIEKKENVVQEDILIRIDREINSWNLQNG